jgi:hypothetical protein
VRRDGFDAPSTPMTIPLNCGEFFSDQAEAREEGSEFN